MKKQFIIEQKPLLAILASMQPICTKRTPLDTTSTIFFQVGHREIVIKSTDTEISLQANCAVIESSFTETEAFLVHGKRMFDIVKELDGEISCTLQNNQLSLKAGGVSLALNIKDAQEFPPFPERIENLMHLDAALLAQMLDKVSFLIPQNNSNPALNGLLLEIDEHELKLTATDGHCLAQINSSQYQLATPRTWLLPRRAIFELKKILESTKDVTIFLGTCGNQLVFSGEWFNFFTKLLADSFPQYKAILDKNSFYTATIDRSHLVRTLRRSSCFLSGQFLATQFGFTPQAVRVSMQNKEVGSLDEELPLQGFESSIDIRFYAPYLLSGLQAFGEGKVQFFLKNSNRPIMFESSTDNCKLIYLVMPVSATTGNSGA